MNSNDLCRDEYGELCPAKGKGAIRCSNQHPCYYAEKMKELKKEQDKK